MLKVQTIDDAVGKGLRIGTNKSQVYEARSKGRVQTRLYVTSHEKTGDKMHAIVRIPTINGSEYAEFKTLTDRLNDAFDTKIKNRKRDFVEFIHENSSQTEKGFVLKTNLKENFGGSYDDSCPLGFSGLHPLALTAGITSTAVFWGALMFSYATHPTEFIKSLISGIMVGDMFLGTVGNMAVNAYQSVKGYKQNYLEIMFPPEFGLAYTFVRESLNNEIISGDCLPKLHKLVKKHKNLISIYEETSSISKLKSLNDKLKDSEHKILDYWNSIIKEVQFKQFDQLQGIFVTRESDSYEDAYNFLNYMVNGGKYNPPKPLPKKAETPASPREQEIQRVVSQELNARGVPQSNVVDLNKVPKEEITIEVPK